MMSPGAWAVRLPRDKAPAAGALRLRPGVHVRDGNDADALWLRGGLGTEELDLDLRKLPGAERFTVAPDGTLTPAGSRLPAGRLPADDWQPLSTWLTLKPQTAALTGEIRHKAPLRIVRSRREEPASVLLTTLSDWVAYATTAPLLRLRPLRFAVSADGRALVRGRPLPPLPGRRCVEHEGIAVPCGFDVSPAVDAATLRSLLGTRPDDLALFDEDGSWERIHAADFVAATRANVRASAQHSRAPVGAGTSRGEEHEGRKAEG